MRPDAPYADPDIPENEARPTSECCLHLAIPGSMQAVRGALAQVVRTLALQGVADEQRGTVELVLAEVMNNISKHAYAGACGRIELDIARDGDDLSFSVVDDGRPMPCGVLPRGCAAELDCAVEDLPEGGFGWRLIRELTRDLVYLRIGERNHLAFRIPARA